MAVTRAKKAGTKSGTKAKVKAGTKQGRGLTKSGKLRRQKTGPVNEWMELRRSPIQGLGGFARVDIPKGTRIIEYTGEKITNAEADRRYDDEKMRRHHTFLFILNSRTILDAAVGGNEARFINHSCDPNCEAVIGRGHIWIEARRAIPAGAELLYDYQFEDDPEYTEEDLRFYTCRCGAKSCRGTIVKTKRRVR